MIFEKIKWLPTITCSIFVVLIIYASIYYPGGSERYPDAQSYSMAHNYMCDIVASKSKNGTHNSYSNIALSAMFFMCAGLAFFFLIFPYWLSINGIWKHIIRWGGLISMIAAMLIFTDLHNIMIGVASLFGLPPLIGVFYFLYRHQKTKALYFGVFCLVLLILNNVIYYTDFMEIMLPLLQKSTFVMIILWLVYMNRTLPLENQS